jgi:hypothetical protein
MKMRWDGWNLDFQWKENWWCPAQTDKLFKIEVVVAVIVVVVVVVVVTTIIIIIIM